MAEPVVNTLILDSTQTLKGLDATLAKLNEVKATTQQAGTASKEAFSGKDITNYSGKLKQLNSDLEGQKQIIKDTELKLNELGRTKGKVYQELQQDLKSAKQLQSEINSEIKQTTSSINQQNKASKDLSNTHEKSIDIVKKLGVAIAGAYALKQIADFNIQNVKFYLEAQRGEFMLKSALQGREAITKRLINYAIELQNRTGVSKDAIINQMQFLSALNLTESMMKKVIQTALDMSSRIPNMTFETAIQGLATTLETGTVLRGLSKYNLAVKSMTKEQLLAGGAVEAFGKQFKGAADEIGKTKFGEIEILKNQLKEIREELGQSVWGVAGNGMQKQIKDLSDLNEVLKNVSKLDTNKLSVILNYLYGQIPIFGGLNLDRYNAVVKATKELADQDKKSDEAIIKNADLMFLEIIKLADNYQERRLFINKSIETYAKTHSKEQVKIYREELYGQLTDMENKLDKDREISQQDQLTKDKEFAKLKLQAEKELSSAILENQKTIRKTTETDLQKALDDVQVYYDELIKKAEKYGLTIESQILKHQKNVALTQVQLENADVNINPADQPSTTVNAKQAQVDEMGKFNKSMKLKTDALIAVWRERNKNEIEANKEKNKQLEKDDKESLKNRKQISKAAEESLLGIASAFYSYKQTLDDSAKQKELAAAGDNASKIKEINNRYAEKEKQRAISQAWINSILGATNAIATANNIYAGIILAAGILAEAALYTAQIQSQPVSFSKGVIKLKRGKYKKGIDTIPAFLNENESVMTAEETEENEGLFTAIRKGKRDDYIYKNFVIPTINKEYINAMKNKASSKESEIIKEIIATGLKAELDDYELRRKLNTSNSFLEAIYNELRLNKRNFVKG